MRLDISRVLDQLESTEKKNQQIIQSLGQLYHNLELTQNDLLGEVSHTIEKIQTMETIISAPAVGTVTDITSNLHEALSALNHTRESVNCHLSNTIYDLRLYKDQLLNKMLVTKVWKNTNHLDVNLAGVLQENSDLGFFKEAGVGLLTINVKSLVNFQKEGIQVWLNFCGKINKNLDVRYEECSTQFIETVQDTPGFINSLSVVSILTFFSCSSCRYKREVIMPIDFTEKRQLQLPKVYCSCNQAMNFCANQESILQFITKLNTLHYSNNKHDDNQTKLYH